MTKTEAPPECASTAADTAPLVPPMIKISTSAITGTSCCGSIQSRGDTFVSLFASFNIPATGNAPILKSPVPQADIFINFLLLIIYLISRVLFQIFID